MSHTCNCDHDQGFELSGAEQRRVRKEKARQEKAAGKAAIAANKKFNQFDLLVAESDAEEKAVQKRIAEEERIAEQQRKTEQLEQERDAMKEEVVMTKEQLAHELLLKLHQRHETQ